MENHIRPLTQNSYIPRTACESSPVSDEVAILNGLISVLYSVQQIVYTKELKED